MRNHRSSSTIGDYIQLRCYNRQSCRKSYEMWWTHDPHQPPPPGNRSLHGTNSSHLSQTNVRCSAYAPLFQEAAKTERSDTHIPLTVEHDHLHANTQWYTRAHISNSQSHTDTIHLYYHDKCARMIISHRVVKVLSALTWAMWLLSLLWHPHVVDQNEKKNVFSSMLSALLTCMREKVTSKNRQKCKIFNFQTGFCAEFK